LIAPYFVNYHLEHHLLVGVPCFRLHAVHQWLTDAGYGPRMSYETSYIDVLRRATELPNQT
ncbi:MAG: fatty acid desaturase, partial [Pseudomonadota bacterium]